MVSEVRTKKEGAIEIVHHDGIKCDRCWNYVNDSIEDSDGGHLCPRCLEVVKGLNK